MAKKATFGLDENIAGALTYVLTILTGLIFYLAEEKNKFVRFHAVQSMIVFGGLWIISFILSRIPMLGLLNIFVGPIGLILWILLMVKAYQGEKYKLPMIGEYAEKYSK